MRVLLFHEHTTPPGQGGGGMEAILRDHAASLRQLGHDVSWLQSAEIERAVTEYRPDVVNVMTIHNAFGVEPVKWLQEQRIPHVWTMADYWPFCSGRNLLKDFVKAEPCSAVSGVCDSRCSFQPSPLRNVVNGSPTVNLCEYAATIMRRNGVRTNFVAEPGIDTALFRPGEKVKGSISASCAWGMHPVKGWPVLQEAMKGMRLDVNLITGLPREQVAEALQKADIYVFPSIYEETFGLCLCEAMASGCACIASDVAGARAQIEDGITGLLVPPRDPEALRQAILRLLADDELRRTLGRNAAEHVAAEHTLEKMGERWLAVYQEVCNGRQSDPVRRSMVKAG